MTASRPSLGAVKEVFDRLDSPGTPLTTADVAAELDCATRAITDQLETLVADGDLETKSVGEDSRVWWQPGSKHALRESEERLQLATEVGEIGIWELDLRTLASPIRTRQHDAIFGYDEPVEDWTFEQFLDHVVPAERDRVERSFREGFETGVWSFECRINRVDGEQRWITAQGRFFDDERGEPELARGVVRDVTDRKRRETQLERQNKRLKEFARVVSHDLRNPLTVAQGRLELALEEHESEDLDAVARAHQRMSVLIEDLLRLARKGQAVEDLESVDLDVLAEECWETLDRSDARLETASGLRLVANRSRLKQLIENLVRNAIEHGGDEVSISLGALDGGFYLEDDGPGIPDAIRDDVLSPGVTTSDEGTGIGLSIVADVAVAHGWDLEITEGTEGGARFEITGVESTG